MRRRQTVYLVVFIFWAGLGLCLTVGGGKDNHGSHVPSSLPQSAEACATSVVPSEPPSTSASLLLILSLNTEQNTFYEGVSLRPPSPPPRG